MSDTKFTRADLAYLSDGYSTLEALCADRAESAAEVKVLIEQGLLPRPSYILDDGTGGLFPSDYFRLADEAGGPGRLREWFAGRHRAASLAHGRTGDELEQDWQAYLDGTFGICLRQVTPETIVRKAVLVASLCEFLMLPRPRDAEWRRAMREQVEELDALEREFTPDYDRGEEQDRPPTRDLLIAAARERYPDVFAEGAADRAVTDAAA